MTVATSQKSTKKKAVLVGVAGSYNAFSLSLYNLKAYALDSPQINDLWDIAVIQRPLVNKASHEQVLPELLAQISEHSPDLVGFSCYMWNIELFQKLAGVLLEHSPEIQIVFGGPEMARDYALEGKFDSFQIHYCVSGEGEQTFLDLLTHLSHGTPELQSIEGLSYRVNLSDSLAVNDNRPPFKSIMMLPSPFLEGIVDDEVLLRHDVEANIETQRGCNLRCSYCIYHKDMNRVTYSGAERVIKEIKYVVDKGVKKIRFVDANFSSDLKYAKEILTGMIEGKFELKVMFELIPGFIDEELAGLFGEFISLHPWNEITTGIGVQTINPVVLKKVRRSIKKEKFVMTFDLLRNNNVFTKIDLIIGLPGENMDSIELTLEYMIDQLRHSQSHLLCCHVMRGLPGTELLELAKEDDMVFSSKNEPHELVESRILPRQDMLQCLRRTAVIFRMLNHVGWADREFISGKHSDDTSIREAFFSTRQRLGLRNMELVDLIVDGLMEHLKKRNSLFSQPEFPQAETWWWAYATLEVQNPWLMEYMTNLESAPHIAVN